MLQAFIFIVLLILLISRPAIGIGVIIFGLMIWIIWTIFSILWPVILALVIAGIWFAWKLERKLRGEDHINIERKEK